MPLTADLTKFTTASEVLANYSFEDIASGLTYTTFYGFQSKNITTAGYHLSSAAISSNVAEIDQTEGTGAAFAKVAEFDFDTSPFKKTRTASGQVYINIPLGVKSGSGGQLYYYVIAKLYHYDGTTETLLGTAQTQEFGEFSATTTSAADRTVSFTVSPKLFAVGDLARLTLEMWAKKTNAGSGAQIAIGTSPDNWEGTRVVFSGTTHANSSRLKLNIPFLNDN